MTDGIQKVTRTSRWVTFLFAFLALLQIPWTVQFFARKAADPPGRTLEEIAVATAGVAPTRIAMVELRGQRYVVWLAASSGRQILMRGGSGPPCYIFDRAGNLVGWSPTTGDREYHELVQGAWNGTNISVDEALRLVEPGDTPK